MVALSLAVILVLALAFALPGILGAPYVPILRHDTDTALKLADLKPGQTLIDLGSGDGRLLRIAASRGVRCIGYEVNPFMVALSWLLCLRYRHLITIHLANFWQIKLPEADVVYVFLMPKFMAQLGDYLSAQIHQPTKVVSYAFKIPGRTIIHGTSNTFVYEYGQKPARRAPSHTV